MKNVKSFITVLNRIGHKFNLVEHLSNYQGKNLKLILFLSVDIF